MKSEFITYRAFLFGIAIMTSMSSMLVAQKNTSKYSPKVYKEIKSGFYSKDVQALITYRSKDKAQQKSIEEEYFKFMALTPMSKVNKVNEIGSCLVDRGLLKSGELVQIRNLFVALSASNETAARTALNKLLSGKGSSPVVNETARACEQSSSPAPTGGESRESAPTGGETEESTDNPVAEGTKDLVEAASTLAGAVVGGAVAGTSGAKAGAKAGKASGEVTTGIFTKIYNWLWKNNKGSEGIVLGPNGEDCTPPYINLVR